MRRASSADADQLGEIPVGAARGKRATISRQQLLDAAIRLLGPHRSVSTLSLREVTREAGIAPNSFYRHFRDIDELSIALIEQAGAALRRIVGEARRRLSPGQSAIRSSVDAFMDQLEADEPHLHILLREGTVGSRAFKRAVERQVRYFEDELSDELGQMSVAAGRPMAEPALASRAITRLLFALGGTALDRSPNARRNTREEIVSMVRMIVAGAQWDSKR